ncbi:MAG: FHA domain-containing protein, partial [Syntrophobacterales bacterium]
MKREIVLRNLSSRETYRVNLPCVIGRSDEADLKFSDRSISQHHALIEEIDNEIWIKDLESANGVLVNRQKIEAAAILEAGDSIQLGHTKLLVSPEDDDVFKQTDVLHSVTPKG